MRNATIEEDKLILRFSYDPGLLALVRNLSGRSYNPKSRCWSIGLTKTNVNILERSDFWISNEVYIKLDAETRLKNDLNALSKADNTDFESKLPLRPYQKVGAKFLKSIGSGLLADDVGIGKTLQALAVVEANLNAERNLILCPAILKYQWETEIKKFIPGADILVIEGKAMERIEQWKNKAKYIIANYELLLRDFEHMDQDWDYIIGDEATRISNSKAKQTKALKKLRAKHRIALTGTPISNHPQEVWSIIDWIAPGKLGNYYQFINRYCLKNYWGSIEGYQNLEELAVRLHRFMIRRLKSDVLPELPERIITDLVFKLSEVERELYKKLQQEILFEIEQSDINKINDPMTIQMTIVKMIRLRQLADSMELLGESQVSTKLEVLKELLVELSGKKIIIFTEFSKMADILEREIDALKITGEVSSIDRSKILELFKTADNNLLVMSSAGQFGLNLQSAEVIIHYDQPWSLAKISQREGRAHRMGQEKKVLVYNLLAKSTVDMHIRKILMQKQQLSGDLLGDPLPTINELKEMLRDEVSKA